MNDDDKFNLICCCIVAVAVGAFVYCVTWSAWERDAVNKDHAEYYLDTNYSRQWRWKE